MESDLLTPRQLAQVMGKSYSSMQRWLRCNRARIASCGFQRGTRWEYSLRLLREAGVVRDEVSAS